MFSCSFYSFGQSPIQCKIGSFQKNAAITCKRCNKFCSKLAGWGRSLAPTCLPRDEGTLLHLQASQSWKDFSLLASPSGIWISAGFLVSECVPLGEQTEPRGCGCAEGQSWGLSCALGKQAELPCSRAASAPSCCCSAVGREPCWMAEAHWVTANESGVERVRIRLWM